MTKKISDKPLIASDRAKWDPEYQREVALKTGPARLPRRCKPAGGPFEGNLPAAWYERVRATRLRMTEDGHAYFWKPIQIPRSPRMKICRVGKGISAWGTQNCSAADAAVDEICAQPHYSLSMKSGCVSAYTS